MLYVLLTIICDTSGIIILRPWDFFWHFITWLETKNTPPYIYCICVFASHSSLPSHICHVACRLSPPFVFIFSFYFCLFLCPICGSLSPRTVIYVRPAVVHATSAAKPSHGETSQVWSCRLKLWFRDRSCCVWARVYLFIYTSFYIDVFIWTVHVCVRIFRRDFLKLQCVGRLQFSKWQPKHALEANCFRTNWRLQHRP